MAQVSGSHFKLLYDNLNLANGHVMPCFILGTLYQTFQQRYPSNIVDTVEDDGFIYLYPIEISAAPLSVINTGLIKLLPIEQLKTGVIKLLINIIHDPTTNETNEDLIEFEKQINSYGLDSSNVIFFFGNEYANNTKMNFCNGMQGLVYQARELHNYPYNSFGYISDCLQPAELDRNIIRPKKFVSPNNMMKPHRTFLAYLILKNNMLNDGIFSFIQQLPPETITQMVTGSYDYADDIDEISQILSDMLPYELDTKGMTLNERGRIIGLPGNVKKWYVDSYFHFATETTFTESEHCFLSEKVFRPIINLQPFLLFGDRSGLAKLQSLGFKTFSPFIDESYDSEIDHKKRLLLLEKELLKLHNMSLLEIHNWYYSITDILIHNQQHLKSFANYDFFDDGLEKIYRIYNG